MTEYKRNIELTDTGMVVAEVFVCTNEQQVRRIGVEFFDYFSVRGRLRRARKWCDKLIKTAQEGEEIIGEPQ